MVDLKKLRNNLGAKRLSYVLSTVWTKKIIFHSIIFIFVIISIKPSYAIWYEEPAVMEKQDDIDSMWWLSKKKKEALKKEQEENIKKWKEENKNTNHFKWLYDENNVTKFPKNKWEIIDEYKTGTGYNYYFDENGYLLRDTITPDFKIVDKKGREVDNDLRPIAYDMSLYRLKEEVDGKELYEKDTYIPTIKEPAKVIIGEGVVIKDKVKIFSNQIDKNMLTYVNMSNGFIKETKATTYDKVKWKKCSTLKGNGGYVIFNNPNNNFNKVNLFLSIEEFNDSPDTSNMYLKVYDADKYDDLNSKHRLEDIDEIYTTDNLSGKEAKKVNFTFDRTVKRLRFEIVTDGMYLNRKCLFKDFKYGFSKSAYREELKRKKEEEEEIEELKRLGIWVDEDDYASFEALDEDGNEIEEDEEEHVNENLDDEIGGISYEDTDETVSYEDKVRDRTTGPAFDESLQNEHTWRDSGPAFCK